MTLNIDYFASLFRIPCQHFSKQIYRLRTNNFTIRRVALLRQFPFIVNDIFGQNFSFSLKRIFVKQNHEENNAHRPYVRSWICIKLLSSQKLRSHKSQSASVCSFCWVPSTVPWNPKVNYLDDSVRRIFWVIVREQYVLKFQVSVNDPFWVAIVDSRWDLLHDRLSLNLRAPAIVAHKLFQFSSCRVLHDDHKIFLINEGVDELDDVWML